MNPNEDASLNAQERLKRRTQQNQLDAHLKQLINDELDKRCQWLTVTYQGCDADSNLHKVRTLDGKIILAQAQSIPGNIEIGSILFAIPSSSSSSIPHLVMPL